MMLKDVNALSHCLSIFQILKLKSIGNTIQRKQKVSLVWPQYNQRLNAYEIT